MKLPIRYKRFTAGLLFVMSGALLLAACDRGDKLAEVNGKDVSREQFEAYLTVKRINPRDEAHRQAILDEYLQQTALAAVIEKQELLDQALIDAEAEVFRKQLVINRYFDKYLDENVSEDALRNYYNAHAGDFETRKMHAMHILLRTNRNMSDVERKAKLTTAQEVHAKLKAGADFAEIAKTYSEDLVSGKKGGDLGWLNEGAVDKRFAETVFAMQPGEISEPFETAFGYHVVKVLEGPLVVEQPFEAVKGNIRYLLRKEKRAVETERLLGEIRIER